MNSPDIHETMEDYSIRKYGSKFYGKLQRKFSRLALGPAVVDSPHVIVFTPYLFDNQSSSVDSMDMDSNRDGIAQSSSVPSRQRTLSEFLDSKPREGLMGTQLDDSVWEMPNGQEPWPQAQQLNLDYHPQHSSVPEQGNALETAAVEPEREPTNPCTLCSADDHDCVQEDCLGSATREPPIDLSPLRELPGYVKSMQQGLEVVQEGLHDQAEQRLKDQEIALSAREDNRKQVEDLQNVVRELRDQQSRAHRSWEDAVKKLRETQSQAHHDLHGAVEELCERYAHLDMVQNNEKRKVSWLTSRLDNVVDRLKDIDDSIRTSDGRTQSRFDAMATMMEQVLLITSKIAEKTRKSFENKHSIDEEIGEIAHLSKRQTTSLTVQPEVPTNMDSHTFRTPEKQLNNHSEPADPQENPAKRQGPGEYSVTEELQQTVEFNSITLQNEMDDCEGTREHEVSTQQDSPTSSNVAEQLSQATSCARRTPEETLQDNNDLTIAMNELGQARVQHDRLHEVKGDEVLTWNVDPDALWDRCAPND